MRISQSRLALAAAGAALLLATPAQAADYDAKVEQLSGASQEALNMLIEHRTSGTLNTENALHIIQEALSPQFDYGVIAQQTLGKHWRKADDQQRARVTELFRALLEKTYSIALSKFTDQQITYEPAEELKDGSVKVPLLINNKGKNISLEYLIKENDGAWVITDVKIEKVSLLGNYRRQFNSIIRKGGVDGLIKLLEAKS